MSLQLHLHPPIMTRGQGTQEEPDEFPYLNVEFLYLIKRAATPSFHSNLPRNKEREEHILRLLLLKTTTCPSRTLLDPTCRYYFAYYSSSGYEPCYANSSDFKHVLKTEAVKETFAFFSQDRSKFHRKLAPLQPLTPIPNSNRSPFDVFSYLQ